MFDFTRKPESADIIDGASGHGDYASKSCGIGYNEQKEGFGVKRNRMNVEEFKVEYGEGYTYTYNKDNQPNNEDCLYITENIYITEDTRTFTEIRVARNPDIILFLDENGNRLAIDGIAYIKIHPKAEQGTRVFFSVVCDIRNAGYKEFVFLAKKR